MNWTEIFSKFKYKRHCKGGGGEGGRERAGCLTSAVRVTLAGGIEKASHAPDKSRWRQHFFKFMLRCNICVRRRRTHTNRLVFTEITFEGFMDQSQRDRSWCPAISATGIQVQMFSIVCAIVFFWQRTVCIMKYGAVRKLCQMGPKSIYRSIKTKSSKVTILATQFGLVKLLSHIW